MSSVSSTIDATEAQKILDKHNCARRRYGLAPLVWDWQLAAHAQEHANRCIWNHASTIGLGVPGEGENLSLAMGKPVDVDGWLAEERIYDCVNGSCRPTPAVKMCGHWTQVCWHNTGRVGCGKQRCASLQSAPGFINSDILVCRYTPPGNWIGQRMSTEQQCAQGAGNSSCGAGGAGSAAVAANVSSVAAKDPAKYIAQEKAASEQRDVAQSTTSSEGNLSRIGMSEDKFTIEQQRIARLRAAAGLPPATAAEEAATTRKVIPTTTPLYAAQVPESEIDSLHAAAPQTVVFPDPASDGYAPAEETVARRANFSTALIVIIALIVVLVVAAIAYFMYHYREGLARWSMRLLRQINIYT